MLPFHARAVDDDHERADNAGEAAPVAPLPDNPTLEADLADDRRAELESAAPPPSDPLGLYALEVERDEAVDDLAANLPANASLRLARHAIVQRVLGSWETVDGWIASVTSADCAVTLSQRAARPLAAAELLLNAWRARGAGHDDGGGSGRPTTAPAEGPRAPEHHRK